MIAKISTRLFLSFLSLITILQSNLLASQVATDIADIEGPIPLPKPFPYYYFALGLLITVVVILLALFLKKKFQSKNITIPAWEKALNDLQEIEKNTDFVSASSYILRDYIEKRFSIKFTKQTSEEFLSSLQSMMKKDDLKNSSLLKEKQWLEQYLQTCDLVKFAGKTPDSTEIKQIKSALESFITNSIPQEDKK
ncbi:MAG: DUF4381 family protein [Desulfotalea sp.]